MLLILTNSHEWTQVDEIKM